MKPTKYFQWLRQDFGQHLPLTNQLGHWTIGLVTRSSQDEPPWAHIQFIGTEQKCSIVSETMTLVQVLAEDGKCIYQKGDLPIRPRK